MRISNALQLKEAIILLEARQEQQKAAVVDQFHKTYESLKPVNIIKNAFHKISDTPGIANKIIGTSIGLGAGVLSKKIFLGKPTNILKRMFGVVLELAVANTIAKNSDGIRRKGFELVKKLIIKKDTAEKN